MNVTETSTVRASTTQARGKWFLGWNNPKKKKGSLNDDEWFCLGKGREQKRGRQGRRLKCCGGRSRRVRAATTRVLPAARSTLRRQCKQATRLIGPRPGTSHPQFDPSSHNDSVICTNYVPINTRCIEQESFHPVLVEKAFLSRHGISLAQISWNGSSAVRDMETQWHTRERVQPPFWQNGIHFACRAVDRVPKNRWTWGSLTRPFASVCAAVATCFLPPEAPASWPLGPALTGLGDPRVAGHVVPVFFLPLSETKPFAIVQ